MELASEIVVLYFLDLCEISYEFLKLKRSDQ